MSTTDAHRAKAAATLVDILTTVQRTQQQGGHHSSGAGGALREAVMEAAGWGQEMRSGLHGGSRGEGPLLAVVRARVEVSCSLVHYVSSLNRTVEVCVSIQARYCLFQEGLRVDSADSFGRQP